MGDANKMQGAIARPYRIVHPVEQDEVSYGEHKWAIIAANGMGIVTGLTFFKANRVCKAMNRDRGLPWKVVDHKPTSLAKACGIKSERNIARGRWIAWGLTQDQARKIVDAANSQTKQRKKED